MKLRNFLQAFLALALSACGTVTVETLTPEPGFDLPDLAVDSIFVAMVDRNGRCVDGYQIFASIVNRGTAPAENVTAVEMSTGSLITIGRLEAGAKMDLQIPAGSGNRNYLINVDPQNVVSESNETNNNLSYLQPTPTAFVGCADVTVSDATPTPSPFVMPAPLLTEGLIYADPASGWILRGDESQRIMLGTYVNFTPDGLKALSESGGDIFMAEPMDNPGRNITYTADMLEMFPQWWPGNPTRIVFNAVGVNEREQQGWRQDLIGHAAMMNPDGSDYQVLSDAPSFTKPAPGPDGKTIAFDVQGWPWLYEVRSGTRAFEAAQYGFSGTPANGLFFTSPTFSPDGRFLTWWVSHDETAPQRTFSLVLFDLVANTNLTIHSYDAASVRGWLSSPVWSPDGQWIAFHTRYPDSAGELWINPVSGAIGQRVRLGTDPVWSPDGTRVAYVQWSPQPDVDPSPHLSILELGSWNTQQTSLPTGSFPLIWVQNTPLHSSYFPMFSAPPDWLTHSNANPPYQIQYPPNARIEAYPEQLTIHLPFQQGTQTTEKSARIETRIMSEQECYASYQWEGSTQLNGREIRYRGGKDLEHAAGGLSYVIGNYAAYSKGFCYSITTRLGLHDTSSGTTDTPVPMPSREDMDFGIFLYILATFRIY